MFYRLPFVCGCTVTTTATNEMQTKPATTTTATASAEGTGTGDGGEAESALSASASARGLVFFRAESWERRVEWVMALSTLSVARTRALEEVGNLDVGVGEGSSGGAMGLGAAASIVTPSKVNVLPVKLRSHSNGLSFGMWQQHDFSASDI